MLQTALNKAEKCYNTCIRRVNPMLKREISERLYSWKNENKKKALCVIGARQIGKTTIIREFARKEYEYFVEVNFILDKGAEPIFDGTLDADTIIENLTAFKMQKLEPGKTLIFLDEIQECPNARCAIKFLVEDGRFDYIESESLLSVKYKEVPSYAVGFAALQSCYEKHEKVPQVMHETLLKLFAAYIVVGGMPDVVQTYVNTHDIGKVIQVQRNILELYRQDIAKYAEGSDKKKIKAIFDSIASQLDDKNRRFVLNHIDENGRMNRYESKNNRKNLRLFFDVFERVIVCAYFYICILLRTSSLNRLRSRIVTSVTSMIIAQVRTMADQERAIGTA